MPVAHAATYGLRRGEARGVSGLHQELGQERIQGCVDVAVAVNKARSLPDFEQRVKHLLGTFFNVNTIRVLFFDTESQTFLHHLIHQGLALLLGFLLRQLDVLETIAVETGRNHLVFVTCVNLKHAQ